jgi:outer membrane autotransporter protein
MTIQQLKHFSPAIAQSDLGHLRHMLPARGRAAGATALVGIGRFGSAAAGLVAVLLAGAAPAQAYTTCTPGGQSGTETCGPDQTINEGVAYSPNGALRLNVLRNTRINAQPGERGILIPGPQTISPPSTAPTCPAGATLNPATDQCEDISTSSAPTCPAGSIYNAATDQCEGTAQTVTGDPPTTGVTVSVAEESVITSPTNGIEVQTDGPGAIAIDNAGAITAAGVGILASSELGPITILNQTSGQIVAPVGIAAGSNAGPVSVSNAGSITFGKYGIAAGSGIGPVTVTNSGTIAQGAAIGTELPPALTSGLPVILASQLTAGTAGVFARTGTGPLTLTNSGTITGVTGVDVGVLGSAILAPLGVPAPPGAPGALTINNSGSITGTGGPAINAVGVSPAQVNNSGTVTGFVTLNADAVFNNLEGGAFAASGTSSFGGGTFNNAGTVSLAPDSALTNLNQFSNTGAVGVAPAGAPSSVSITAGQFTNAGTINLQNGRTGDQLTINGNYVGQSGRLNVDFATQSGTSDRLVINGNASGSTGVFVTNITPGEPFTTGASVVQVNGTADPNAFTLANAQGFGTVTPVLLQEVGSFNLGFVPNEVGLSGPIALIAAQTIAFQSAGAVLDRVTQLRARQQQTSQPETPLALSYAALDNAQYMADPIRSRVAAPPPPPPATSVRPAMWARGFGDWERRDQSASFAFAGTPFTTDLGYRQRTGGILGGADLVVSGLTSPSDGLIVGAFGGYTAAEVKLETGGGVQDFSGGTVGTYVTYLNGGFFSDLMLKADLLELDITAPGLSQSADLRNYHVLGNVGYKIDMPAGWYVEPTAGLEYVRTDFTRETAFTATTVPLTDGHALRGKIGARVGTEWLTGNVRIEPSFTAFVYSILDASDASIFFGGTGISLPSDEGKVRGELQGSVNFFDLGSGISGFVRADLRFGEDLIGGGAKVGLRYQW